jgi:hypothetical protein
VAHVGSGELEHGIKHMVLAVVGVDWTRWRGDTDRERSGERALVLRWVLASAGVDGRVASGPNKSGGLNCSSKLHCSSGPAWYC